MRRETRGGRGGGGVRTSLSNVPIMLHFVEEGGGSITNACRGVHAQSVTIIHRAINMTRARNKSGNSDSDKKCGRTARQRTVVDAAEAWSRR